MAAILGAQLAFTMIVASVLSKFSGRYSFGRWILTSGLARYVHPSDEELRRLAAGGGLSRKNKSGGKAARKSDSGAAGEDFTVLKSAIDVQLDCVQIRSVDLLPLQFYTEFQWLMDFAVCAMFIHAATEVYYAVIRPTPGTETNLSVLWCILVGAFALKVMYATTAIYFRVEDGGERVLCVLFGAFFLVAAMAVLIVDERTLDFGLESAYRNFTASAADFRRDAAAAKHEADTSEGPVSLLTVRMALAAVCSAVGTFLTFPGLRLARMHADALRYARDQPLRQLMLHINMVLPLVVALTWVAPLFRDHLVASVDTTETPSLPSDEEGVVGGEGEGVKNGTRAGGLALDEEAVQFVRIVLLLGLCAFRFSLVWIYLQAYLNMAVDKVAELKREAGRIGATELKKSIVRVYYYLCVVALQYLAPLVLLLFTALLLKTLGDCSMARVFGVEIPSFRRAIASATRVSPSSAGVALNQDSAEGIAEGIIGTASEFSQSLARLKLVFTPVCFRGLLSFSAWWICSAWFTTSAFGLMYYSYFRE